MKQLTIEHLAPYLPFGLGLECESRDTGVLTSLDSSDNSLGISFDAHVDVTIRRELEDIRPILRPLSQLTQEIEHNGERFVPHKKLGWESGYMLISCVQSKTKKDLPYRDAIKLFEWHFDVFGLIDAGLGIERGAAS